MSTYESVRINCPKCDVANEVQCWAGETYETHDAATVPKYIAKALDGEVIRCHACDIQFKLVMGPKPKSRPMTAQLIE